MAMGAEMSTVMFSSTQLRSRMNLTRREEGFGGPGPEQRLFGLSDVLGGDDEDDGAGSSDVDMADTPGGTASQRKRKRDNEVTPTKGGPRDVERAKRSKL
ncbi:hypothetical protein ACHAP8_003560 [Fusarium lateritium]